ncbi:MAG: nicotinate-nucleotide adenylyltransferase [Gammaproteobacteria bacterium]|nr:nicotinate-nucleotide adenylyltransferase [Gammaproteobacteria bacterium]
MTSLSSIDTATVKQKPLAIMGGAFDPVHYGHVRTAAELREVCDFGEVLFIPSANPPHRERHIAPADLRVRMLEAALAGVQAADDGEEWCSIDHRELRRDGPSWTVLRLEELRREAGSRSMCMMVGMDAFLSLGSWHRWEELPGLAHIVVAHRPGWQPPQSGELGDFVQSHLTTDVGDLHEVSAGRLFIHEVTQLDISSSDIRRKIAAGHAADDLLPPEVLRIAVESGCYAGPPTQEHHTYA